MFLPFIREFLLGLTIQEECVLAIDGSSVGQGCMALMVSLVYKKRSIPLAWVVCSQKKGHLPVDLHLEVLELVKTVLPEGLKNIVLLGDGEFDSVKLQEFLDAQGWHYVLRTAKNTKIQSFSGDQFTLGDCDRFENEEYLFIEDVYFQKDKSRLVNFLLWHQRPHKEAIYLLSNLDWAWKIMALYQKRFSIETIFGDLKSRGFNIHKVRVKNPEMMSNLLIMVVLAFLVLFAMGLNEEVIKISKVIRKDRIQSYSIFCRGLKKAQFIIENKCRKIPENYNILHIFFCVRF